MQSLYVFLCMQSMEPYMVRAVFTTRRRKILIPPRKLGRAAARSLPGWERFASFAANEVDKAFMQIITSTNSRENFMCKSLLSHKVKDKR